MALYFKVLCSFVWLSCVSGLLERSDRPPCNDTLSSLRDLQDASLNPGAQSTDYVICVDLTSSNSAATDLLRYVSTEIKYASVIISGNKSLVNCEVLSRDLPLDDYSQFPLIFSNSSLVVIEDVHFEGCMRPLKFNWVTRVEIISSTLR